MKWFVICLMLIGCSDNQEEMKLFISVLNSDSGVHTPSKPKLSETDINIVFDGNSLTKGYPSSPDQYYPTLVMDWLLTYANSVTFNSYGVNSQALSTMLANAPTKIDPLVNPAKTNIIVVFEDANGILSGGKTGQQNYNDMQNYVTGRKSAGYDYAIVITGYYERTPYQAGTEQYMDEQTTYFNLVQTTPIGDVVCDLRNASNIGGVYGQAQNTTYFADYIHLKNVGYQSLADYVINNGILNLFDY